MKSLRAGVKLTKLSHTQLLVFMTVFSLIGGYLIIQSFAASIYYLSPTGNDSNPCSQSQPCKSFNRGYRVASPGDTVEIAAGSYANQSVSPDTSKTSTTDVLFRLAAGATVNVDGLYKWGASHTAIDGAGGTLKIAGFEIGDPASTSSRVTDITIRNADLRGDQSQILNVDGATLSNVQIGNVDWGGDALRFNDPVGTSGDANDPANIVVENSTVSGVAWPGSSDHPDCIAVSAGHNLTFRNNRVWDCGSQGLYLISELGGNIHDVTIENNMFGDCATSGAYSNCVNSLILDVRSPGLANITVRYNSFAVNTQTLRVSGGTSGSNIKVYGNAGEGPGCENPGGVTYGYNVWDDAKCSTTDIQTDPMFVSNASGSNYDLHLKAGSPAIGKGDPSNFPTADFDGNTRTSPPDAGADEYGAATSAANLYVSTTGNDSTCVRGDSSKPCKSFDKAYSIAQLGDIVQVAGGDYGDQVLTLKSDKSASGNLVDVVFQPAPGATVTIGEFNSGTDTSSPNGAKHVTIKNMSDNNIGSKYCTWGITNGSEDITIINGDACNINIFDSKLVTIDGGDWGPCVVGTVPSSYDDPCSNNKIAGSQNVTITHTAIHDIVTADAPSHHIECMFIVSGSNITISGNKFYGCGIYDIFIQRYDGGQISNLLIENNWFGQTRDGEYPNFEGYSDRALAFSPRSQAFSNVNIRNNSFHPGADISLDDDGWGGAYSNFKVANNILRLDNWMCGNGVIFSHNIYTGTTGCGGTGSKVASAGYVKSNNDASMDYHLTAGAPAIDAGDSTNFPSDDIDGQTRTSPPDAGADEYGGTTSPPPPPPGKTGDLNSDGSVNILDLSILLSKWNTTDSSSDLNSDGSVNILDLSILLSKWGT